eukprot:4687731-Amphidinium_carterae.1
MPATTRVRGAKPRKDGVRGAQRFQFLGSPTKATFSRFPADCTVTDYPATTMTPPGTSDEPTLARTGLRFRFSPRTKVMQAVSAHDFRLGMKQSKATAPA